MKRTGLIVTLAVMALCTSAFAVTYNNANLEGIYAVMLSRADWDCASMNSQGHCSPTAPHNVVFWESSPSTVSAASSTVAFLGATGTLARSPSVTGQDQGFPQKPCSRFELLRCGGRPLAREASAKATQ